MTFSRGALGLTLLFSTGCAAMGAMEPDTADLEDHLTASPPFDGDPANHALFAVDISHWERATSEAEMDCFWDSGVRHVIAGTQNRDIAREQLATAVRRGMSVDAYVYIYWDGDTAAQVAEAFDRARGFPIQRMWLDLEEHTGSLGSREVIAQIQQALDACRADGSVECGIYTGSGFWYGSTGNTTMFSDVPLWFAHYDGRRSLSDWPSERFGGWSAPTAKQYDDGPLCGMAADLDVMQVLAGPTVVVDRSPTPEPLEPAAAPTDLYPYEGLVTRDPDVKLIAGTVPHATRYQLALETWSPTATAFRPYYTWSPVNPFLTVSLPSTASVYRFRARAQTRAGWGAWSGWSSFDVGHYTGRRPDTSPAPAEPPPAEPPPTEPPPAEPPPAEPPPAEPPPAEPPAADVATGLAPDGVVIDAVNVTLTFDPVARATRYEVAIENLSGSAYVTYWTYTTTTPSKTFYPAIHGTSYRFRVRATVDGTARAWSSYAGFDYR